MFSSPASAARIDLSEIQISPGIAARPSMARLALEALDVGVLVVSISGHILEANSLAVRLLKPFGGAQQSLARARSVLAAVLDAQSLSSARVVVADQAREPQLVMTFKATGDGVTATVLVRRCDAPTHDMTSMRLFYGLTAREGEILDAIGLGDNIVGVAERLALGVGTVRNHLKRIFDKTGVRSQSALVRLIERQARL